VNVNFFNINTFLHYGYLPDAHVHLPESLRIWFNGDFMRFNCVVPTKADLIKKGSQTLIKNFEQEIGNDHNKTHVVPLSGGLDSRTILANLLEHLEPSKIITVTFGLPGSPDYERAQSISKKAGVQWESIDLSPGKWKWSTDLLINAAKKSERPTRLFDNAVNQAIQLKFGRDYVYWSGFMGDSLGCIEQVSKKIKTWKDAKTAFVIRNCKCGKYYLPIPDFNPEICLPDKPFTDSKKLDYYSQLNHCIKQQCLTKHIYSPKGYDIRYPFLNPLWVSFISNVPAYYSYKQALYRKVLQSSWPNLFNNWNVSYRNSSKIYYIIHRGKSRFVKNYIKKLFPKLTLIMGSNKNYKYLDWNYALRYQDDFKSVVYSNLQDLKARKIIDWLDIEKLWTDHQNIKNDLSLELMTLAALEIHLKAGTVKIC